MVMTLNAFFFKFAFILKHEECWEASVMGSKRVEDPIILLDLQQLIVQAVPDANRPMSFWPVSFVGFPLY